MNGVAPACRPTALNASARSAARAEAATPPRPLARAGRGRSDGRSRTAGAPASAPRQKASWVASSAPRRLARCQRTKSAYCTGSGGRGDGRPAAEARIERRQLAHQEVDRPAVAHHVMQGEESDVARGVQAQQRGAQQRPARQVERAHRLLGGEPQGLRLARLLRQAREVDAGKRQRGRRGDPLHRLSVSIVRRPEGRPQRLVPRHHLLQAGGEGRAVERAGEQDRGRQVVGRVPRLELVEEPEPLLREGERQGRAGRPAARPVPRRRLLPLGAPRGPPRAPRRSATRKCSAASAPHPAPGSGAPPDGWPGASRPRDRRSRRGGPPSPRGAARPGSPPDAARSRRAAARRGRGDSAGHAAGWAPRPSRQTPGPVPRPDARPRRRHGRLGPRLDPVAPALERVGRQRHAAPRLVRPERRPVGAQAGEPEPPHGLEQEGEVVRALEGVAQGRQRHRIGPAGCRGLLQRPGAQRLARPDLDQHPPGLAPQLAHRIREPHRAAQVLRPVGGVRRLLRR